MKIGIDLGTANVLVFVQGQGITVREPSVVAIDTRTKRVLEVGAEAKRMVGRTPASIQAIRPLRDGVISDFDVTEQMIKYFIARVHDRGAIIFAQNPKVVILEGRNGNDLIGWHGSSRLIFLVAEYSVYLIRSC